MSDPGTVARKSRRKLVFAATRGKAVPTGYLRVDQALDRLGRARYPDQWGYVEGFFRLPFQYLRRRNQFVRYRLARRGPKRIIEEELVENAANRARRRKLREVDRLYRSIRTELRTALETGVVMARKLTPTHYLEEISNPGIWAAQMRSIFYLGLIHEGRDGREVAERVLIERASFENWLRLETAWTVLPAPSNPDPLPPPLPTAGPGPPTRLKAISIQILQAVTEEVSGHSYKLTWPRFSRALSQALKEGSHVASHTERYKAWKSPILKPIKLAGGPLEKAHEKIADERSSALVEAIKNALLAEPDPPPLTG